MNAAVRLRRGVASPLAALLVAGAVVSAFAIGFSASPAAAAPIHVSDEASFRPAWDSNANHTIILDPDIPLSTRTRDDADRETFNAPLTAAAQGHPKNVQDCARPPGLI